MKVVLGSQVIYTLYYTHIVDEEHENMFGKGKTKRIIDRYFNHEGIEYMVHYVRKNVKLLDDKTFMDFKLCANAVDTHNMKLLHEQRIFRGEKAFFGIKHK